MSSHKGTNMEKTTCPDCGCTVGNYHLDGCDVEPCAECGGQRLSCGCESETRLRWSGEWPGVAECREFGWYAKLNPGGPGYVPCSANEKGAMEDLNRLQKDAKWDKKAQRWKKKE
jgi:hypothetical protein